MPIKYHILLLLVKSGVAVAGREYKTNNFLDYNNGLLQSDIRTVRGGFLPVQERDGSNLVTREYVWGQNMGGGIGGLLNMRQSGLDYAYLYDGKGNVTALLDPSQAVAGTYAYDPFGSVMKKAGTMNQPYMFSTKEYDPETGLSYYGFRYYNASIGKWITRDPIEEEGGVNLYGFVGNNAGNAIDPLGLWVLYGGAAGTGTIVRGKAGGTGIAFDSKNGGWGTYNCSGGSGGFGAGAGGEVGFYSGGMSGSTVTLTGGIGPWSVGLIFGQDGFGIVGGASFGVPFQATFSIEKCTFTPFNLPENIKPDKCH